LAFWCGSGAEKYGIFVWMWAQSRKITREGWLFAGWLLIALIISCLSYFPVFLESLYATGFYPGFARLLRAFTQWIPFSLGDILYAIVLVYVCRKLFKLLLFIRQNRPEPAWWKQWLFRNLRRMLAVYVVFKVFWGLNYYRQGIAWQLQMKQEVYNKEQVKAITDTLISRLNDCRRQISDSVLKDRGLDTIFSEAYHCYQRAAAAFPFLRYSHRSVKPSLYSGIADYLGFTGYYNPFTGEAQVRYDVPRILLPYITAHEMAHQLGYASESEANFVGYLAAVSSNDVYFRYSVYLDLFSYAQAEEIKLYGQQKDFKAFESVVLHNRQSLDTLVKLDRKRIRSFFQKRQNAISPAVSGLYDQYLKMNQQLQGVNSYNEVVGWLIAYQKKYGKI
jgi:hypothetical protein